MLDGNKVDNEQAGVPPILFQPSSVSGPVALVMAAARGVTPLGALTAAGVDALVGTHPTCLAPGQTFAQPPPSPTTLVVSYTTFSPITQRLDRGGLRLWAGLFSVAVVVRVAPAWTYCFVQ